MAEELRIVLRNAGKINPERIEDFIAAGGYGALEKARSMEPQAIIDEVRKSNLRGRGGAGFNVGFKWSLVASVKRDPKYVVCNLDEGEPGTYKDRIIVEQDPHTLLEGMAICAHVLGSTKGYIYCRGEYPYVVESLNRAINQAKAKGVLGKFDIEVRMGAGAYVCGEETALLESIEGGRGNPRYKPPFPNEAGLWGQPTVINNVESFANIPAILEKGAAWYAALGAPNYPATKILTLTGDVVNRVVIEVPTNTTIREVIYDFGGGIRDGKKFGAVQIGGTSGAFIPESYLDTPIDFDSMRNNGFTLGTGAVFVMDETRNIVGLATRIANFFEHESCGKCTPCREGTYRIAEIMRGINKGEAGTDAIDKIKLLSKVMENTALCGLGQAAPGPVLSIINHFNKAITEKFV